MREAYEVSLHAIVTIDCQVRRHCSLEYSLPLKYFICFEIMQAPANGRCVACNHDILSLISKCAWRVSTQLVSVNRIWDDAGRLFSQYRVWRRNPLSCRSSIFRRAAKFTVIGEQYGSIRKNRMVITMGLHLNPLASLRNSCQQTSFVGVLLTDYLLF